MTARTDETYPRITRVHEYDTPISTYESGNGFICFEKTIWVGETVAIDYAVKGGGHNSMTADCKRKQPPRQKKGQEYLNLRKGKF